jgi:transcriptional regulator with XRE-family HTH domain
MKELKRLKRIKADRGMSYEVMAHAVGVTSRTLYRWLNDESNPSLMGLMLIQRYLDAEDARMK